MDFKTWESLVSQQFQSKKTRHCFTIFCVDKDRRLTAHGICCFVFSHRFFSHCLVLSKLACFMRSNRWSNSRQQTRLSIFTSIDCTSNLVPQDAGTSTRDTKGFEKGVGQPQHSQKLTHKLTWNIENISVERIQNVSNVIYWCVRTRGEGSQTYARWRPISSPNMSVSHVIPCHCSGIGAGLGIRHQLPVQNRNILDAMGNFLTNVAAMQGDLRSPIFHNLRISALVFARYSHLVGLQPTRYLRSLALSWKWLGVTSFAKAARHPFRTSYHKNIKKASMKLQGSSQFSAACLESWGHNLPKSNPLV